jgi:hypothetical protein
MQLVNAVEIQDNGKRGGSAARQESRIYSRTEQTTTHEVFSPALGDTVNILPIILLTSIISLFL